MARQLVESLAAERSSPRSTTTSTASKCSTSSSARQSGEEIVAEPHTEPPAKVLDLVAALEASIEKSKTAKQRHPSGTGATFRSREARGSKACNEIDRESRQGARQEGGTRQAQRLTATTRAGGASAARGARRELDASTPGPLVVVGEPTAVAADLGVDYLGHEPGARLPP